MRQGTPTLWQELKRRRVVRVGIAYVIVAAAVGGGASDFLPGLGAPDWVLPVVLGLIILGLPVALVLAWAFDVTPEGVRRDDATESEPRANEEAEAPAPTGAASDAASKTEFDAKAIAVLPFANMSDDSANEFFADGVTEDILMRLAHVTDLHVVSRTSVMRYKGTTKALGEIAAELRVGTVLEGSVRRVGDQVRVVAQLIEAATDRHVWAETYDRQLADVFAVQAEVAEHIARALEAHLAPGDLERVRRMPTADVEAYDLALRGRSLTLRLRPQDIAEGRRLLERAMELDPEFVHARVWLSLAHVAEGYYGDGRPRDAFLRARELAEGALAVDEEAGLAWLLRGLARYHLWDWTGGRADLMRAKELDPGVSDIRMFVGHQLILLDRPEEAIEELEAAKSLAPVEALPHMHSAIALCLAGKMEAAFENVRRAKDLDPGFFEAPMVLGWFLALDGRLEDAVVESTLAADLSGHHPWPTGYLALIQKAAGQTAQARKVAEELKGDGKRSISLLFIALVEDRLEDALGALETAAEDRHPLVPWFYVNPVTPVLVGEAFMRHPRVEALRTRIWGGT